MNDDSQRVDARTTSAVEGARHDPRRLPTRPPSTRRSQTRWRTRTGSQMEAGTRRLRAELPVRLPVGQGRRTRALQAHRSGRCTRGSSRVSPRTSRSAASTSRVGAFSKHQSGVRGDPVPALAAERDPERRAQGRPAARPRYHVYSDPKFQKAYPMWKAIFDTLKQASVRPKTPAYQSVSLADLVHSLAADLHQREGPRDAARPHRATRSTRRGWCHETAPADEARRGCRRGPGRQRRPPRPGGPLTERARSERRLGWLLCAPSVIGDAAGHRLPHRIRPLAVAPALRPPLPGRPGVAWASTTTQPYWATRRCGGRACSTRLIITAVSVGGRADPRVLPRLRHVPGLLRPRRSSALPSS